MKTEAISKALANAETKGMASDPLSNILDGSMPAKLPADPESEPMGPPSDTPPVETGEVPDLGDIGLPLIAMDSAPDEFPANPENDGDADDILEFLF